MVREASHSIRFATCEMKKLSQLQCSSSCTAIQSLPSAGSHGRPSISSWPYSLLYSCLPCSPAACELMLLVVQSSPKSVSFLLCLFPCLGWGNVIPCGNFEGRAGKNNDSRTKHVALYQFWESEIQLQVRPSTESLLYFCLCSFQFLLK